MSQQESALELTMDANALFREEMFTDRKMGTIRRLTPVRHDGSDDPSRAAIYVGQAQLLTPVGAMPLAFEIPADSLEAAIAGFGAAAKEAVDRTMEELKELRRDAASSIIIPDAAPGGFPPGGAGPGGIQMP